MPCHRRYTWEHRPHDRDDAEKLTAAVTRVLRQHCEDWPQWFSLPQVTGSRFGILQFEVTVSSKDQWRVRQRARKLLAEIQLATSVPLRLISEVQVLRPEPHDHPNRGARWRARRSLSSTRTDSPPSPM